MGQHNQLRHGALQGRIAYEHLDAFEKMTEPALPAPDAVFSHLFKGPCRPAQYARAIDVWQTFNWTTIHQFLDLYMKTDLLPFPHVIEEFLAV